jgi:HK97 family phage prohead protease
MPENPPAYMRAAARKGLEYNAEGLGGDGLTDKTIREAREMAEGTVSDDKWIRIAAWIARHLGDLDSPDANPESDNYPSAGVVAHLLWGSGPSKRAAQRTLDYAESVVARIRAEEESQRMSENRALPDELSTGDTVAWVVETEAHFGLLSEIVGTVAYVDVWEEHDGMYEPEGITAVVAVADLKKISPLVPEPEMPDDMEEEITISNLPNEPFQPQSRDKWVRAAWSIKARIEELPEEARSLGKAEVRTNHIELRAIGDGMTFEGYAAVFNSQSEDLGFREIIKPGAFRKSLRGRHRMMLLWNHDASQPLASTRNGSLKLTEDDRGLKVSAQLPDTTLGRDIAELVRTGVIDAMSFGFQVKKDSWSADGTTRTLEEIALHEVSLVSFPAYEGTAGSVNVREVRNIDADQLADGLMKLELGDELDPEQARLISEVVEKLTKTEEVQAVEGDILALKKKKLDLILKGI